MSVNTTDPQDNEMDLFEEKIVDREVQITISPPLPKLERNSSNIFPKTLHKFGKLPKELQIKIFKEALPDSRIISFDFEVLKTFKTYKNYPIFSTSLKVDIEKFSSSLSLLETCKVSNASVYLGGFEKIKILPPGSGLPLYLHPRSGQEEIEDHNGLCDESQIDYTYLRPSQDIIVLNACELLRLYQRGGSINLEKLTHITVDRLLFLPKPLEDHIAEFLKLIQEQCVNLKRLSFIDYGPWVKEFHLIGIRLLDISGDLSSLHILDYDNKPVAKTLRMDPPFSRFFLGMLNRQFKNMEQRGNTDAVSYWDRVDIVTVVYMFPTNIAHKFHVPALSGYVFGNDDGSLVTLQEI
ncbi:hypothetical protein NHQ30_004467 [Ciborinia camelliae]|nr:hypothetical protein NHQ30_004467 [Ciborinia camelliae]